MLACHISSCTTFTSSPFPLRSVAYVCRYAAFGTAGTRTALGWTRRVLPLPYMQKLMRHSDIRTTMNTYGDVVTDEATTAAKRVAAMAITNSTHPG